MLVMGKFQQVKLISYFNVGQCTINSSRGLLINLLNPSVMNYTFYSYWYIANDSSATLTFTFVNNRGSWLLDDIVLYNGSQNIIINGNFQRENLHAWNYSYADHFNTTDLGEVTNETWAPYNGPQYWYSLLFATIPGHFYQIRFSAMN